MRVPYIYTYIVNMIFVHVQHIQNNIDTCIWCIYIYMYVCVSVGSSSELGWLARACLRLSVQISIKLQQACPVAHHVSLACRREDQFWLAARPGFKPEGLWMAIILRIKSPAAIHVKRLFLCLECVEPAGPKKCKHHRP